MRSQTMGWGLIFLLTIAPLFDTNAQRQRNGKKERVLRKQCRKLFQKRKKAYDFYGYVKPFKRKYKSVAESDALVRVSKSNKPYKRRN